MPFLKTMTKAILPGGLTIGQLEGTQSLDIYSAWGLTTNIVRVLGVYAEFEGDGVWHP